LWLTGRHFTGKRRCRHGDSRFYPVCLHGCHIHSCDHSGGGGSSQGACTGISELKAQNSDWPQKTQMTQRKNLLLNPKSVFVFLM
jgi:hypothetical protein